MSFLLLFLSTPCLPTVRSSRLKSGAKNNIPVFLLWHELCTVGECGTFTPPPLSPSDTSHTVSVTRKDTSYATLFTHRRPASAPLAALVLIAGASLGLAGSAAAQQFKVTASGTIYDITDPNSDFNSSVAIGIPYTSSCLFDYATPDSDPSSTLGNFTIIGTSAGATAKFGDYQFVSNTNTENLVQTADHFQGKVKDQVYFQSYNDTMTGGGIAGFFPNATYIFIDDSSGLFLSSDALPLVSAFGALNLHDPNSNYRFFAGGYDQHRQNTYVLGTITSLSAELVNPVPEASTTLSLGLMLGLGGMAVVRRWAGSRRSR